MIEVVSSLSGELVGWLVFVALLSCLIGAMAIAMLVEIIYRVLGRFVKKDGEQ